MSEHLRMTLMLRLVPVVGALVVLMTTLRSGRGDSLGGLLLVVALVTALVLSQPRVGIAALVVFALTLLPTARTIALGGIVTDHLEALAGMLVLGWLLARTVSVVRERVSPFRTPLTLLVCSALVGAVTGTLGGSPGVLGPLKTYGFYLLALPITAAFPGHHGRTALARLIGGIADVASVLLLASRVLQFDLPIATQATVITRGQVSAVPRVLPPLVGLLIVASLLVVARMAAGLRRDGDIVRLLAYAAVLLLTFNRSTWVGLTVASVVVAVGHRGSRRPLRLLRVSLAVGLLGTLLLVGGSAGALGETGRALSRRAASVVDPQVRTDQTYESRREENDAAVAAIKRSPLVGVGLNRGYGLTRQVYLDNPPQIVTFEVVYIHNSLLAAWLQLGLLGVIALGALAVTAVRSVRSALRLRADAAALCLAGAGALLAFGLQALVQGSLLHRPTIIAVALALALIDPWLAPGEEELATVESASDVALV